MLKKSLLLGIAVLCLSILTGCPMEPSFEVISFPKELPADPADSPPFKDVSYLGQLQDALDDDTTNNIRIVDNITLSGILLIPKQKKVEIMPQKNVMINGAITIAGSVNIMEQACLTINEAGTITVMDDADMLVRAPLAFESPESVFTVEPRGRVLVEEGGSITLNGKAAIKGQVSLGNNVQMTAADRFEMDGDLTVHHGAQLILGNAARGGVNGTITVLKGGHIWDQARDGGWAWREQGVGKILFQYGSYASIGPAGSKVVDSVFNPGSQFILTSTVSQLTIQKDEYLLEGDAVLAADYSIANTLRLSRGVLKTSSGKSFSVKSGGNLIIENQGVLEIVQGTTGELQGAIEVKNGGKYIDVKSPLFPLKDNGSITFDTGSVGLINGKTEIGTNQTGGAPGGTLQLEDGKVQLKKDECLLNGKAKLVHSYSAQKLTLAPSSVLIIEGVVLTIPDSASLIGSGAGETAAQITLLDGSSKITFSDNKTPVIEGPRTITWHQIEVGSW